MPRHDPEETKRIRDRCYKQFRSGVRAADTAKLLGISERMVYRHVDAKRLEIAEHQVAKFNQALNLLSAPALKELKHILSKIK